MRLAVLGASRAGALRLRGGPAPALRRLSDAIAPVIPETEQKKGLAAEVLEPIEKAAVSKISGAPVEQMNKRTLRIFQQSPTVVGGQQNTLSWKVQWEDTHTKRWTNPLMGWTSTSDPLSNAHMTLDFGSKEEAIKFAQSNGWTYEVTETTHVNRALAASGPKKYADNFRWKGPKGRPFPDLYIPPPPPK